ncbi:MAG: diaminopimelate decarboxylase family protein [Christensenellales bacterium]
MYNCLCFKGFLVPKMAQIINEYNLYMDAVSMGDLYVALNANFPANHLVFHGNNKSKEELIFAIENKIGLIVVDNYYELKNLIQLCEERKIVQNILFRVNPGIDAHTHQYIQTAKFTSKFGESIYDEKTIDNIMKTITTTKSLNLLGFHAHIGSQIHEMEAFKMEIDKMIKFQMEIASKYKYSLPLLNLGGGFGIKYEYQEKVYLLKI